MSCTRRISTSDECVAGSFVSVDGTDCRMQELSLFSTRWFSHESNWLGLRYESATSHGNGLIVRINGPFHEENGMT